MLNLFDNTSRSSLDGPQAGELLELRTMVERLKRRLILRQREVAALRRQLHSVEDAKQTATEQNVDWSRESYVKLVKRLQSFVEQSTPTFSNIVVASKGDPELLKFPGSRSGWHLPQNKEGIYAGYNPPGSPPAIQQLEELRGRGAHFFVLPATAFWWFHYYADFRNYLFGHYRKIADDSETCAIFDLRHEPFQEAPPNQPVNPKFQEFSILLQHIQEILGLVLPDDASIAIVSRGNPDFLNLGSWKAMHFPMDQSGAYVGQPADSAGALTHLTLAREEGAEYLLFPNPALWWLDYYKDFAAYLRSECRLVLNQPHIGTLFHLPKSLFQKSSDGQRGILAAVKAARPRASPQRAVIVRIGSK